MNSSGYQAPHCEIPETKVKTAKIPLPWVHLVAGATGGIVTSIVLAPLDMLRTRLQSDLYRISPRTPDAHSPTLRKLTSPIHQQLNIFGILRSIKAQEGWRGLFRGLGPSVAGVAPATAVKFYVYGNCKTLGASLLGRNEHEDPLVQTQAAICAGLATATATNPIWLIKTRLQLDKSLAESGGKTARRQYQGSFDYLRQVIRQEGIPGLYRGLTASYLGTLETALHLVLYEQLKVLLRGPLEARPGNKSRALDEIAAWLSTGGAAGAAKLAASLLTYPHEVVRTRLRQAPPLVGAPPRYTGLVQCFCSVWIHEGWRGLYGGLTPHLVRSIPSAAITLGVYEFVLRMFQ